MKVFRVVTQRDSNTIKAPGIWKIEIEQVDRRYARWRSVRVERRVGRV